VFEGMIRDDDVYAAVAQGQGRPDGDDMALVQSWVPQHSGINVDANYATSATAEHPQIAPIVDRIVHVRAPSRTKVDDYKVRMDERLDPRVERNRAIDTSKSPCRQLWVEP
jgi:hypothetical protein